MRAAIAPDTTVRPIAGRVLTTRALNRALLARQQLLARAPARTSLPRILERVGGLQAQYAPSMYVGLWSRLEGFELAALTRALERRTVIQATLMRSTIHLVSARDYWPLALAVRDARRRTWLQASRGLTDEHMRAAADRLRAAMRDGPVTRKEAEQVIGKDAARAIGMWLDVVRAPPSGTWERRRAGLWADAESWVGPADSTPAEGLERLVERYLGGFGPATRHEIASFTGLHARELDPVLGRLGLRSFRTQDGTPLLDVPRAPLPDPRTPAPPRLLPHWDATLLVHARSAAILPEAHRPRVFHVRKPHSTAVYLIDGAVAGAWRLDARGRVELEPYEPLASADRRALQAEGSRLSAILPP